MKKLLFFILISSMFRMCSAAEVKARATEVRAFEMNHHEFEDHTGRVHEFVVYDRASALHMKIAVARLKAHTRARCPRVKVMPDHRTEQPQPVQVKLQKRSKPTRLGARGKD